MNNPSLSAAQSIPTSKNRANSVERLFFIIRCGGTPKMQMQRNCGVIRGASPFKKISNSNRGSFYGRCPIWRVFFLPRILRRYHHRNGFFCTCQLRRYHHHPRHHHPRHRHLHHHHHHRHHPRPNIAPKPAIVATTTCLAGTLPPTRLTPKTPRKSMSRLTGFSGINLLT